VVLIGLSGHDGGMRRTIFAVLTAVILVAGGVSAQEARAGRIVRITGGGWGHGLGMSQYGAYGRALDGESDTHILTHYYTGAHVRKVTMPKHIRVGLLQGQSSISVSSIALSSTGGDGVFRVAGRTKQLARGGTKASWRVEPSAAGGIHLFKNGSPIKRNGNAVFGSPSRPLLFFYRRYDSMVHVQDKNNNYRYGKLEFGTYSSSSCAPGFCLRLVLAQPMQKYLYGLGEVPSSWPRAALQSQVIAGRTYAYAKTQTSGQHRYPCDCAVYDSTLDQAYIGDAKRTGSGAYWNDWKNAVTSTRAQVLIDKSRPIEALYMSSSGGYTENNENVWGGTPVPYLRGVRDRADAVAANPNHSWTVTMPWSRFASDLRSSYNVGTVDSFKLVPPFGVSGRVTVVKPGVGGGARIVGSNGVVRASGWDVKNALGLKDTLFRVRITYSVGKKFATKFQALHGHPGWAKSAPYAVPKGSKHPKGRAQDFSRGRMTWRRATDKTVWQHGNVLRRYDLMGREKSTLGMPTSDIWGKSFEAASYVHGNIYWSAKTGAHAVRGRFLTAYRTYGGPKGPLSLPQGRRRKSSTLPHYGVRQRFAGGTVYRTPSSHVFALWGAIEARYRKMGEATSKCKYPTSSMKPVAHGLAATFQKGKMRVNERGKLFVNCGS
jgi:peptidoglycan hydrolase-like amidase